MAGKKLEEGTATIDADDLVCFVWNALVSSGYCFDIMARAR